MSKGIKINCVKLQLATGFVILLTLWVLSFTGCINNPHIPSYIASPVKIVVATSLSEANYVQAEDMDGDSDIDIVGTAFDADLISWWENKKGDGTQWEAHSIDGFVDGVVFALVIDLDRDEDQDVVGTAWYGDYIKQAAME